MSHPTAGLSAGAVQPEPAYVTDNESDAALLQRQIGGRVMIRRVIVAEVPYSPSVVMERPRRSRRLSASDA